MQDSLKETLHCNLTFETLACQLPSLNLCSPICKMEEILLLFSAWPHPDECARASCFASNPFKEGARGTCGEKKKMEKMEKIRPPAGGLKKKKSKFKKVEQGTVPDCTLRQPEAASSTEVL